MPDYLVVAIDGTYSSSLAYSGGDDTDRLMCIYNESHTVGFHRRVRTPANRKYFHHGPESGATGLDCEEIESAAWTWLRRQLRDSPLARVILVGHSRGGHIVTNLAIRLSRFHQGDFVPTIGPDPARMPTMAMRTGRHPTPVQPVHFLGLYDAVDMTFALGDTTRVPANVEWLFHAKRSHRVGSRQDWGNTATLTERSDPEHYFQREFDGTHGSIGGAIPEGCDGTMDRDRDLGGAVGSIVFGPAGGVLGRAIVGSTVGSCSVTITPEENAMAAAQANAFVLEGARRAGIPMEA